MSNTEAWVPGDVAIGGWNTLAGARRAIRTADQSIYGGRHLEVRVRPHPEWTDIGIEKDQFVLVLRETAK